MDEHRNQIASTEITADADIDHQMVTDAQEMFEAPPMNEEEVREFLQSFPEFKDCKFEVEIVQGSHSVDTSTASNFYPNVYGQYHNDTGVELDYGSTLNYDRDALGGNSSCDYIESLNDSQLCSELPAFDTADMPDVLDYFKADSSQQQHQHDLGTSTWSHVAHDNGDFIVHRTIPPTAIPYSHPGTELIAKPTAERPPVYENAGIKQHLHERYIRVTDLQGASTPPKSLNCNSGDDEANHIPSNMNQDLSINAIRPIASKSSSGQWRENQPVKSGSSMNANAARNDSASTQAHSSSNEVAHIAIAANNISRAGSLCSSNSKTEGNNYPGFEKFKTSNLSTLIGPSPMMSNSNVGPTNSQHLTSTSQSKIPLSATVPGRRSISSNSVHQVHPEVNRHGSMLSSSKNLNSEIKKKHKGQFSRTSNRTKSQPAIPRRSSSSFKKNGITDAHGNGRRYGGNDEKLNRMANDSTIKSNRCQTARQGTHQKSGGSHYHVPKSLNGPRLLKNLTDEENEYVAERQSRRRSKKITDASAWEKTQQKSKYLYINGEKFKLMDYSNTKRPLNVPHYNQNAFQPANAHLNLPMVYGHSTYTPSLHGAFSNNNVPTISGTNTKGRLRDITGRFAAYTSRKFQTLYPSAGFLQPTAHPPFRYYNDEMKPSSLPRHFYNRQNRNTEMFPMQKSQFTPLPTGLTNFLVPGSN